MYSLDKIGASLGAQTVRNLPAMQETIPTTVAIQHYFPGGSDNKASAYSAGDPGSVPGLGRSGEGNGNPLQCSYLANPMDGEAW